MKDKIDIYQEERPWGLFRRFTKNTSSTVKILNVKPNEILSLQSHKNRSEFWHVISGVGFFELDGEKKLVQKDDELYIPTGSKHRIFSGDEGLRVLEVSLGNFEEKDVIRYEDKYGRV